MSKSLPTDLIDLPVIIKTLRKKKRITQARLAMKLNLSDRTVNGYETGRIKPTIETFIKILAISGYRMELTKEIYKSPKPIQLP